MEYTSKDRLHQTLDPFLNPLICLYLPLAEPGPERPGRHAVPVRERAAGHQPASEGQPGARQGGAEKHARPDGQDATGGREASEAHLQAILLPHKWMPTLQRCVVYDIG